MPFSRTGIISSGGSGGDVTGPALSVDLDIALFDGVTGKLLKDSSKKIADLAPAAQGVTNGDGHDHVGGDGAQIDHTGLSNIGTKTHAQIEARLGFVIPTQNTAAGSPADSTTYYWGRSASFVAVQGRTRIYVPVACTMKRIYGVFTQVAGSNEASTLSLLINGITAIQITNALDLSGTVTTFSKTNLNQALSEGDYFELMWDTPAWVTNPTTVRTTADIWVET